MLVQSIHRQNLPERPEAWVAKGIATICDTLMGEQLGAGCPARPQGEETLQPCPLLQQTLQLCPSSNGFSEVHVNLTRDGWGAVFL